LFYYYYYYRASGPKFLFSSRLLNGHLIITCHSPSRPSGRLSRHKLRNPYSVQAFLNALKLFCPAAAAPISKKPTTTTHHIPPPSISAQRPLKDSSTAHTQAGLTFTYPIKEVFDKLDLLKLSYWPIYTRFTRSHKQSIWPVWTRHRGAPMTPEVSARILKTVGDRMRMVSTSGPT
jgi:hypothetical protein